MKALNVLSLFNGMGFGRMALETLNIPVNKYFSSEIDKYANQATQALFPDVIQLGDVTKWQDWELINIDFDLGEIDLLLAGFPCQAWSMAGKQKGDDDPRGALVHDLINIWKQINLCRAELGKGPVKFMFENVKMKKEFLDYINNLFGVEPICINSSLVSAQNRKRYYWTNVKGVEQPEDKGVLLKDILLDGSNKCGAIRGRYIVDVKRADHKVTSQTGITEQRLEVRADNKTNYLTTVQKDNVVVIDEKYFVSEKQVSRLDISNLENGGARICFKSPGQNRDKSECLMARDYKGISGKQFFTVAMSEGRLRKLTPHEYMRLQTVPEHHIDTLLNSGISNSQLYKMAGNGWTHDVITHIFKGLNEDR